MFVKQSMILVFLGIFASAIAADFEEYDVDTLKNLLRSKIFCANAYTDYINSCQTKYKLAIKKCECHESAAKSKLAKESLEARRKYIDESHNACKAVSACGVDDLDVLQGFACLSKQGSEASTAMSKISYETNKMLSYYNEKIHKIEYDRRSCTNSSTWELTVNSNAGMAELNKCFISETWTLGAP